VPHFNAERFGLNDYEEQYLFSYDAKSRHITCYNFFLKENKMKISFEFVFGIIIITLFTGVSLGLVGQTPESTGPFPWYLPLNVFVITALPFVCGIVAGKKL